jgi:hypothetical protein
LNFLSADVHFLVTARGDPESGRQSFAFHDQSATRKIGIFLEMHFDFGRSPGTDGAINAHLTACLACTN